MSSLADAPVTPEHELHDGKVVLVPLPRTLRLRIQEFIQTLLLEVGKPCAVIMEFPYKPLPGMQFWYADVALRRGRSGMLSAPGILTPPARSR